MLSVFLRIFQIRCNLLIYKVILTYTSNVRMFCKFKGLRPLAT